MKVNDPNLSSLGVEAAARPQEPARTGNNRSAGASTSPLGDDVHLSELVRSLRSLAADSPERQARLEQIARAYADGAYHVDAKATASKIIDDSLEP